MENKLSDLITSKPQEEMTASSLMDNLMQYLDTASRARFIEIYNWIFETNYTIEDIDWEN
jgi:hypothetical protein